MKKSNIIMLLAALLPLALFIFPLWNITLEAPQYPIPLGMDIHINDFSDTHPHDIKNINLMNHYVGMKYIPKAIPEFKIFPIGIIISTLIGLIIAFKGNYKWFLAWFILMIVLSAAGMYDFYLWEHNYGHDLDPNAIMQFTNDDGTIMGFQPPIFGSKDILNFKAHSYPRLGALFLGLGIATSLIAYLVGKKQNKKNHLMK
jgi:copper chaperone NosL